RGQHPARPISGNRGERIIHRFRLTQGDDVGIVRHGVSFLLEVLAGFSTRHDTPTSQTPSPISRHSSQATSLLHNRTEGLRQPERNNFCSSPITVPFACTKVAQPSSVQPHDRTRLNRRLGRHARKSCTTLWAALLQIPP